jgi:ankyrin repeat protein
MRCHNNSFRAKLKQTEYGILMTVKLTITIAIFMLQPILYGCASDGGSGDNVLHIGFTDVFRLLFTSGDNIYAKNERISNKVTRQCKFYQAIKTGDLERAKKCINDGAGVDRLFSVDYHSAVHRNISALGVSVIENQYEICEYLLNHGADTNQSNAEGPLYYSVINKNYKITRLLLKFHANPNATDYFSTSYLMHSVMLRDTQILKLLLDYGANPAYVAKDGRTALSIAQDNHDTISADLLKTALQNINNGVTGDTTNKK